MSPPFGALRLEPVFLTKVWAAPSLAAPFNRLWSPPPCCGEIWLASDRHQVTPVADGPLAGQGLDEIVAQYPDWVLGPGAKPPFPLLVKLLSVGQWLSVQVHPDDQAARRLENEPWGKSEAWHVLAAAPDSAIVMGVNPGVTREQIARAVELGGLVDMLAQVPARPGDTFHLAAGTIHATGPGLTIFEIQQASDVTYRFYDWDRPGLDGQPRPLHAKRAMEVMSLAGPGRPAPPEVLADTMTGRMVRLVSDQHFDLIRWEPAGELNLDSGLGQPRVLFVLAGQGRLEAGGQTHELEQGQSWLLPAGLGDCWTEPGPAGLTLLEGRGKLGQA